MTDADIDGRYGETEDAAEAWKRAEAAPLVPMTFDIVWKDGDRSPVLFPNITGSAVGDGFLTLYGPDDTAHMINLDVVSHVNIWRHP